MKQNTQKRISKDELRRQEILRQKAKKRNIILTSLGAVILIVVIIIIVTSINSTPKLVDGVQEITTTSSASGSKNFTVKANTKVKWTISSSSSLGCMTGIYQNSLGISTNLKPSGTTTVTFTPKTKGTFKVYCPSSHEFCTITVK